MSKNLDETIRLQSDKSTCDKSKKRATTRVCRGQEWRFPSGQLVSRVVPRGKQVCGDPLQPNSKGEEKRQFLPES